MTSLINQTNLSLEEGFFRLTTDELKQDLIEIIRRVMVKGDRFILMAEGAEIAAIIPPKDLEKLDYILQDLKPSQFDPHEEEYYDDEKGIHCVYPEQVESDFVYILEDVRLGGEIFGLLPIQNLGEEDVDIFAPVAVIIPIELFWIPEYIIAEKYDLVYENDVQMED